MHGTKYLAKALFVLVNCLPLYAGMPVWMRRTLRPGDVIEGVKRYMDSFELEQHEKGQLRYGVHQVLVILGVLEEDEKGHSICGSFSFPSSVHEKVVAKLQEYNEKCKPKCKEGCSHIKVQKLLEGDSQDRDPLEEDIQKQHGFLIPPDKCVTIKKSRFCVKNGEELMNVEISTFIGLFKKCSEDEGESLVVGEAKFVGSEDKKVVSLRAEPQDTLPSNLYT